MGRRKAEIAMKDKINTVISDLKEAIAYLEYASDMNYSNEFVGKVEYAEMYIRDALEGIDMGEWGPFCACYYDDCPHEIKRTPVIGTVHGDDVCVRRLSDVDESICRMGTEFYGGTEDRR